MALFNRALSTLRRFTAHQSGTTAITFALSVVPLMLAGGSALDYMRYSRAETAMQAALDSGALAVAAATALSSDARIEAGKAAFNRNVTIAGIDADATTVTFTLDGNTVKASGKLVIPSGFMQIAGISAMGVDVATEIRIPEGKKAEIALVLDYSGSMEEISGGQVKYVAMKNAATKLVTDLASANPDNVKIGLVPFSHHVYATLPAAHVKDKGKTGTWTGCTQDRLYPYNLQDTTPTTSDATKWGQAISKVHAADGCGAYAPKHLVVRPLTDDFDGLREQLDDMRPYAWTHIALGAEFGYHLLSPNAPFSEGADYTDTDVQKIMVILTDGRQTEPAFGDGARNVAQGESNLTAICKNAKASGITIMTVAFDLRDADTRKRLKGCATDADRHFFIAEDSADLASAFENIRSQITAQVFISR